MPKIKKILLVDDDEATNFYHKVVIEDCGCIEEVDVVTNGKKALDYLHHCRDNGGAYPDIIFLDINMPVMDGWEFMDEYAKLSEELRKSVVLLMLTTSINPDDREKAEAIPHIHGFRNKPLSLEILKEVLHEHFSHIG